jgi:hypothetical protein
MRADELEQPRWIAAQIDVRGVLPTGPLAMDVFPRRSQRGHVYDRHFDRQVQGACGRRR